MVVCNVACPESVRNATTKRTCDRPVLVSMQCTCSTDLEVRFYGTPEGLLWLLWKKLDAL